MYNIYIIILLKGEETHTHTHIHICKCIYAICAYTSNTFKNLGFNVYTTKKGSYVHVIRFKHRSTTHLLQCDLLELY